MLTRLRQMRMGSFGLGMLVGGLVTILVIVLALRLMGRSPAAPAAAIVSDSPDLTLTLDRDFVQRIVDDGLRGVTIPLVTLRDPNVQLAPDAVVVMRLRGDTILLGAQPIVLRMRIVPAATGVQIVTESADVGVLGNVAGPLTARLDERINAELARRFAFADQFDVLAVTGTTSEVVIQARLKD